RAAHEGAPDEDCRGVEDGDVSGEQHRHEHAGGPRPPVLPAPSAHGGSLGCGEHGHQTPGGRVQPGAVASRKVRTAPTRRLTSGSWPSASLVKTALMFFSTARSLRNSVRAMAWL